MRARGLPRGDGFLRAVGRFRWGLGGAASAGADARAAPLLGQDAAMSNPDSEVGGAGVGIHLVRLEGSGVTPDLRCLVDRGSSL